MQTANMMPRDIVSLLTCPRAKASGAGDWETARMRKRPKSASAKRAARLVDVDRSSDDPWMKDAEGTARSRNFNPKGAECISIAEIIYRKI